MTFRVEHEEAEKNMELYVSNPLNAFLLIKRLTLDMDIISTITLQLAEGFMIMVLLKLNYKLFLI